MSTRTRNPLLSLCLIARDAEATIGRTIRSVIDLADEVILVLDQRTKDRTEQIAREVAGGKLRLLRRTWNHHFADARNASIAPARGKFVMVLDADDEVEADDLPLLAEALEGDGDLFTLPRFLDGTYDTAMYWNERFGGWCNIDYHSFIFRRDHRPFFAGRVHERLMFPVPFKEKTAHVRVYHRGTGNEMKTRYYMALMLLEWMDDPTNEIACIYLAEDACGRDSPVEAAEYLEPLDPDVKPFHPVMMARYWATSGLTFQIAYRMAIERGNDPADSYANACANYRRASEINPTWMNPVIRLVTFQVSVAVVGPRADAPPILADARATLADVLRRDPTNLLAGRLLESLKQAGDDPDRVRVLWEQRMRDMHAPPASGTGAGAAPEASALVTARTDELVPAFSIRELSEQVQGLKIHLHERGQHGTDAETAGGDNDGPTDDDRTASGRGSGRDDRYAVGYIDPGPDAGVPGVARGLRIVRSDLRRSGGPGHAGERPQAEVRGPGERLHGPDGTAVRGGAEGELLAPGAVPDSGRDGGGVADVGGRGGPEGIDPDR